jgi:hypothetical protein
MSNYWSSSRFSRPKFDCSNPEPGAAEIVSEEDPNFLFRLDRQISKDSTETVTFPHEASKKCRSRQNLTSSLLALKGAYPNCQRTKQSSPEETISPNVRTLDASFIRLPHYTVDSPISSTVGKRFLGKKPPRTRPVEVNRSFRC